MKGQCGKCSNWLFFKPLSDYTFSCCGAQFETVEDIDLESGASATIQAHNIEGKPCHFHHPGSSRFEPSKDNPFDIHPERLKGEKRLKERLNLL